MAWTPEIDLEHGGGPRTVARTALIALVHWHAHQLPPDPALLRMLEPFKIHVGTRPVPGDDHPLLLELCVAACERRWNKAPVLPEGTREGQAVYLLKWLRKHGDVTRLAFHGQEYDPASQGG
jgi:hypothetical protein